MSVSFHQSGYGRCCSKSDMGAVRDRRSFAAKGLASIIEFPCCRLRTGFKDTLFPMAESGVHGQLTPLSLSARAHPLPSFDT